MEETVEAMDRISELPACIIHHIMSYLSAKEVAQTSVLSKSWNQLWASFPILDLDQAYFAKGWIELGWPKKRSHKKLKEFMKFVDASLLRFCCLNFRMQKFRLFMGVIDVRASSYRIDNWIRQAVGNEVREIDLRFITEGNPAYTLPRTIFCAKSLNDLNLVRCKLEQLCDRIRLYSLRKLTLKEVCVNEEMLQKLANECPLLEDLTIFNCWGFKRLCVSEALKLKIMTVTIDNQLESLQIAVPNLQKLALEYFMKQSPYVIDIAGSVHLQKIKLSDVNLTDQEFNSFISNLPFLEELYVDYCRLLERIKISSNQLKNLEFWRCFNLKAMDVDTPNLLSFVYQKSPIITCSINAPCPWKLYFAVWDDIDTPWYLEVKEFLGVSNQIEHLTLRVRSRKISLNLDELKEGSSGSLPCQVVTLDLRMYGELPSSDYEALLSGLLSICHPKALHVQIWTEDGSKFGQWVYDEVKNIKEVQCCNSCLIKCWRHHNHIIDVQMISLVEGLGRKRYFKVPTDGFAIDEEVSTYPCGTLKYHIDWCSPDL